MAEENIKEAIKAHAAHPDVVVGVDLSGNPSCGNVTDDILPLFSEARASGLKIALHCAEVNLVFLFLLIPILCVCVCGMFYNFLNPFMF